MIEENNLEIDELNQSDEQIILETPAKDEGEIVPSDNEALIKATKCENNEENLENISEDNKSRKRKFEEEEEGGGEDEEEQQQADTTTNNNAVVFVESNQQQQKVLDFSVPPRNIIGGTTATNIAGGLVTGGDGSELIKTEFSTIFNSTTKFSSKQYSTTPSIIIIFTTNNINNKFIFIF
uniref:Uncharacterized protein n=1 Tax=Meloidogyne enterolobii TaxID=390850 RepID=A0A6V7TXC3_MELEN|nr:unnamed protein product [Meloidogyne enterolobii]